MFLIKYEAPEFLGDIHFGGFRESSIFFTETNYIFSCWILVFCKHFGKHFKALIKQSSVRFYEGA